MTDERSPRKRSLRWWEIPLGFAIGLPASILIVIALSLALQVYGAGFTDARNCKHERGFFKKLVCGLSQTCEDNAPYFRSLPSDEEMITHFSKHRTDFERLVQLYRQDPRQGVMVKPTPEMKAIMKRINVKGITGDSRVWMPPDPYSADARRKIKRLNLQWKAHRGYPEARKYSGVILGYPHKRVIRLGDMSYVNKDYYYTPVVPEVENGLMRDPIGNLRLFPTLNTYPPDLVSGYCVYRQFEPQWFIRMCEHD